MIKVPLLLISYFSLFLVSFFSTEDVLVINNTPATIAPGAKQIVEITVTKGQIQGFSKLELSLPAGFTASPAETKGASFTFSGQKAKFVWMTLPNEENFTVTYYIESAENLDGEFSVAGTFSYVKENKRIDFSIPTKTVMVKKPLEPTPQQAAQLMPAVKQEAEFVEMVCQRTVTRESDLEYVVNLKVINNDIKGFGKIMETVPDNCKTEKINDGGAVITQDKNTIKFVWFDVPVANSFEVSYRISCLTGGSEPVIKGQLSYTEDGNPIVVDVIQSGAATPSDIAQTEPEKIVEPEKIADPISEKEEFDPRNTATVEPEKEVKPAKQDEPVATTKPSETPVTSIPSAENGVTYKVQILAAHRVVNKTYLQDKFSFNDKFNIENHEGWVKYTTGKFTEYKDARDARTKLTGEHGKLPGPFVTAYNDGERITVQEALLISKQQWFK